MCRFLDTMSETFAGTTETAGEHQDLPNGEEDAQSQQSHHSHHSHHTNPNASPEHRYESSGPKSGAWIDPSMAFYPL